MRLHFLFTLIHSTTKYLTEFAIDYNIGNIKPCIFLSIKATKMSHKGFIYFRVISQVLNMVCVKETQTERHCVSQPLELPSPGWRQI